MHAKTGCDISPKLLLVLHDAEHAPRPTTPGLLAAASLQRDAEPEVSTINMAPQILPAHLRCGRR